MYDELIEQLRNRYNVLYGAHVVGIMQSAADAIQYLLEGADEVNGALQEKIVENERLNAELERLQNCRHECDIVCLLDKYNEKCAELERVTRERDAAVGDLRGACGYCKHEPTCDIGFGLCEICDRPDGCTSPCKDCVDSCNWEWRGPKED